MLDFRTEQLNRTQQKVAEEEHKRLVILQRIQEYDVVIEQAFQDQQRALANSTLDMAQLQGFPNYIWRLKQSRFLEHQRLQNQERRLQDCRLELQQALIKKKSLDILKEKDHTRYRQQLEKAEEEMMAEIALNRTYRQGSPI